MRRIKRLVVLSTELRTAGLRKQLEDRSRVVARIPRPHRLQELGGHTLKLQQAPDNKAIRSQAGRPHATALCAKLK